MSFKFSLLLITGVCWSITYLDIIKVGIRQKTCSISFFALCLNFSWEVYYSIQGYLFEGFHFVNIINLTWAFLDVIILCIYLKIGNQNFKLSSNIFYLISFLSIAISFIFQHYFSQKLGLINGAIYSAFCSNLLMSILFIQLFYNRKKIIGHTLLIAWTKCIGTLSATILIGIIGINTIGGRISSIMYLGLLIFIIDIWYIYLIDKRLKCNNSLKTAPQSILN